MADFETKLDLLASQVNDMRTALTAQMTDMKIGFSHDLAEVAGDTKAILSRIDGHDKMVDDHENRLRSLEKTTSSTSGNDHEDRLRKVERMIWIASGIAIAGGGTLGAVASKVTGG